MNVHEWVEGEIPVTGILLGSLVVTIAHYEYSRPFRGGRPGRVDFMEHNGRALVRVTETSAGPCPDLLWGCGCPVLGGPNVYGASCK